MARLLSQELELKRLFNSGEGNESVSPEKGSPVVVRIATFTYRATFCQFRLRPVKNTVVWLDDFNFPVAVRKSDVRLISNHAENSRLLSKKGAFLELDLVNKLPSHLQFCSQTFEKGEHGWLAQGAIRKEGEKQYTLGKILDLLKDGENKCEPIAKSICNNLIPPANRNLPAFEAEFDRVVERVRKQLQYILKKKREGKFRRADEIKQQIEFDVNFDGLFAQQLSAEGEYGVRSSSEESLPDLRQKFEGMQSPSVSPRRESMMSPKRPHKADKSTSIMSPIKRAKISITEYDIQGGTLLSRTEAYHDKLTQWAKDQKCTQRQLLGLLIAQEAYMPSVDWEGEIVPADRTLSELGRCVWRGEPILVKYKASELEALWLRERSNMSESSYSEMRLRFLDRFIFPPADSVRSLSKELRPNTYVYKRGARAPISDILRLTLAEQCAVLENKGVDIPPRLQFSFTWGADGSGK